MRFPRRQNTEGDTERDDKGSQFERFEAVFFGVPHTREAAVAASSRFPAQGANRGNWKFPLTRALIGTRIVV
jgi:hypothetical protein